MNTFDFLAIADAIEAAETVEQRAALAAALRQAQPLLTQPPSLRANRDRMIYDALKRLFWGRSNNDAALEFASKLGRYAASATWRRDQSCDYCPYPAGSLNGAMWAILKVSRRPLSAERIRKIVGQNATA